MKLSEYIKKMTELLEKQGDMDCIQASWMPNEGTVYYKAKSGYTGYADKNTLDEHLIECHDIDEASWLVENEYIESEGDLVKVCIINGQEKQND